MLRMRWVPLAAIAALAASSAWAIQVPLKYTANAQGSSFSAGYKQLDLKTTKPAGQWQLPDTVGKYPLYALIKMGDQDRVVMLDRKNADDKFYTRLRIDLNGNGDLKDDPEVTTISSDASPNARLMAQNIQFTAKVGGKELPYAAMLSAYCFDSDQLANADLSSGDTRQYMYCVMQSACTYAGGFDLDGKHYEVRLADGLLNGRFDDTLQKSTDKGAQAASGRQPLVTQADRLYITGEGSITNHDGQPLGKYLVIGDKLFSVKIDQAAGMMDLEPAQGDGSVQIPASLKRIALLGDGAEGSVSLFEPAAKVSLPAGQWRVASYQAERKDAQGDLWRLTANGDSGVAPCTVAKGGAAELKAGEPFMPMVDIQTTGAGYSMQAQMRFVVLDCNKAQMSGLSHEGNNTKLALSKQNPSLPREPAWQAVTAEGEKVASGSFSYG